MDIPNAHHLKKVDSIVKGGPHYAVMVREASTLANRGLERANGYVVFKINGQRLLSQPIC
ncbi:hypothetical protein NQ314_020727 [Rhamnusium bicolor]|uniref:Uncharacterized protein n=1 Tax=Rhamnusium bicolor TaxID=1586634 RepID=A0AAV8WMF7_9CUCU|nr:hypothetical protein NQ314_020727 [Rhamnusium bicolor]